MFCKFCGNKIDENSVFCNKCGEYQTEQNMKSTTIQRLPTTININPSVIKFLGANLVLIISYFVGWIKLTGEAGQIAEFLSIFAGFEMKSISPKLVIDGFSQIRELISYASESIPIQYYLLYLLIIFPIFSCIGIVYALVWKSSNAGVFSKLSATISLFCIAATWYLVVDNYISATIWLYIFTVASIYTFFVTNEYVAMVIGETGTGTNTSDEEGMKNEALEAAELALMPEKMQKNLTSKTAKKLANEMHKDETLEFCYYCGADLEGGIEKCPSCGKPL